MTEDETRSAPHDQPESERNRVSSDPGHSELRAAPDDFFETSSFRKRATWVVVTFAILTLVVIAIPLVYAFTDWL